MMDGATIKLHFAMIRLIKGILVSWEEWLREKKGN